MSKKKIVVTINVPGKWWIPVLKKWINDDELNDYAGKYDLSSCRRMLSIRKALRLDLPIGSLITRYIIKGGKRYASEWDMLHKG